ncbi:MAG: hypothetical protein Q9161_009623, partial [Pseudevernia consocians]
LEAEAEVAPIRCYPDRALLKSKALRGTHRVIPEGNARIAARLRSKKGPKRRLGKPPSADKQEWAERCLNHPETPALGTPSESLPGGPDKRKAIKEWWKNRLEGRWENYQQTLGDRIRSPVQRGDLGGRMVLHKGLKKAESSAVIQLRTEKIGLGQFLFERKVSEHVLLFCPRYQEGRSRLISEAGASDYYSIISSNRGVKTAARWQIGTGVLKQFSLATEQLKRNEAGTGT